MALSDFGLHYVVLMRKRTLLTIVNIRGHVWFAIVNYVVPDIASFLYQGFCMSRKRGVPHRSAVKVAHDRRDIARRHLLGETQAAICAALGLTE